MCQIFPNSLLSAVVTTWASDRLPNVRTIVSALAGHCFIKEIIVYNNNVDVTLKTTELPAVPYFVSVRIINSPANVITLSKYDGCTKAAHPVCFVIDDDWHPKYLWSLLSTFMRNNGSTVVLTNALTYVMDKRYTFVNETYKLKFGFAWLGVGSFFSQQVARSFLNKWSTISPNGMFEGYQDFFFTMWGGALPIVVEADIQPMSFNDAPAALSNQPLYKDFEERGMMESAALVFENREMFLNHHGVLETHERAPCHDDSCVFVSNLDFPIKNARVDQVLRKHFWEKVLFSWDATHDESMRSDFVAYPYHFAVDGNPNTYWKSYRRVERGDFFGLELNVRALTFGISATVHPPSVLPSSLELELFGLDSPHSGPLDSNTWKCLGVATVTTSGSTPLRCTYFFPNPISITGFRLRAREQKRSSFQIGELSVIGTRLPHDIQHTCGKRHFRVVIGVVVSASEAQWRNIIRTTWMQLASQDVLVVFVLDRASMSNPAIDEERRLQGDLIFVEVRDDYNNLLEKTLLFFRWVVDRCDSDYVMKLDHDSFLHVSSLVQLLSQQPLQRLYLGYIWENSQVYHGETFDLCLCITVFYYRRCWQITRPKTMNHISPSTTSILPMHLEVATSCLSTLYPR